MPVIKPIPLTALSDPSIWQTFRTTRLLRIADIIQPEEITRIREEGYRVFRNPGKISPHVYRGRSSSGFTPPGIESVGGQPPNTYRQFWDISVGGPNPSCPHSTVFVSSLETLAARLAEKIPYLFSTLEAGLGELATGLAQVTAGGPHSLRVTHYPPSSCPPDGLLFPCHRDFSVVSLFLGGAEPGLQVKIEGVWQDLENPPGQLTIVAGTMLRFWTGGPDHPDRVTGLLHRVRHTGTERLSLSFFSEPHPDTPLPGLPGQTSGSYITERISAIRHV